MLFSLSLMGLSGLERDSYSLLRFDEKDSDLVVCEYAFFLAIWGLGAGNDGSGVVDCGFWVRDVDVDVFGPFLDILTRVWEDGVGLVDLFSSLCMLCGGEFDWESEEMDFVFEEEVDETWDSLRKSMESVVLAVGGSFGNLLPTLSLFLGTST